jgi:nucleoside-diphosphate-sugar epimerase
MSAEIESTVVTGALGHLGWTYLRHLAAASGRAQVHALDIRPPSDEQRAEIARICAENASAPEVRFETADLSHCAPDGWGRCVAAATTMVHFAAVNPFPDATWQEAAASIDITYNVLLAASASPRMARVVFASSNHVMGRYKDCIPDSALGPGELTTDLPPGVGTIELRAGEQADVDSTAYAAAKLAGERLCHTLAHASGASGAAYVSVRIGACKPGWGTPCDLYGRSGADDEKPTVDQLWAEDLWLSTADFCQLLDAAQTADAARWPAPAIVVNGMSANTDMVWSLAEARRWLGYAPRDDVRAFLPR